MLTEDSEFEAEQEKNTTSCDGRQALVTKGFVAEVPPRERRRLSWRTTSAGDPVVILNVRHTTRLSIIPLL